MKKIAKLVDMNLRRTFNLTNLVRAGVREITLGRPEPDSNQLIQLGAKDDGSRSDNPRIPYISRYHALIRYDDSSEQYLLLDRSSTHGTTVDNKPLEPMTPHVLEDSDSLRFADYGPVIYVEEEIADKPERHDTASFPKP